MRKAWEKTFGPFLYGLSEDPETVHRLAMRALAALGSEGWLRRGLRKRLLVNDPALVQDIAGMKFENPVGLAAGFDKNAKAIQGLEALGFGFIELGTITRYPQPGNPRPRMFRYLQDKALINRMGFNNEGVDNVMKRLAKIKKHIVPIGVSIGKSKATPIEEAVQDYRYSFEKAYPYADYFAVNVSSPNTPGLRSLQDKEALNKLLHALQIDNHHLAQGRHPKPVFVKIAPDLTDEAIIELLGVVRKNNVRGIIAVNTALFREGLSVETKEAGGMSGRPLTLRARKIVSLIRNNAPGLVIIGVGGIFTGDDAYEMLKAGANLLQIYTGFIYGGPSVVWDINRELALRMRMDGVKHISELSSQ